MNKFHKYIAMCIFTVLFTIISLKGNGQDVLQSINNSFSTGEIDLLKKHLRNNLDLSFDQQKSIYSKSQALALLKQRFDKEPPKEFKTIKTSDLNNKNIIFVIYEYTSSKSKYLVYMSIKNDKDGLKIAEIHFESQ